VRDGFRKDEYTLHERKNFHSPDFFIWELPSWYTRLLLWLAG